MPAIDNSKELIIRNKLAAISAMKEWGFEDEYVAKRLKEYVLFCLRHKDTSMRNAAAKILIYCLATVVDKLKIRDWNVGLLLLNME